MQKKVTTLSLPKGFTLVELLIVIAILAILSTLGINNFISSRTKAQDLARKSDLSTIAKALEAYNNDHHGYPLDDGSGHIICRSPATICAWGSPFSDINGTVYIATLPTNSGTSPYVYESSDGTTFSIYTVLENTNDPSQITSTKDCGSVKCNYKVSSPNL